MRPVHPKVSKRKFGNGDLYSMSVVVSKEQLNVQGQVPLFRQLYHGGPLSPLVKGTLGNIMRLIWSKA
jgi:hypothetical protein